jgi:hypothetical protein
VAGHQITPVSTIVSQVRLVRGRHERRGSHGPLVVVPD